MGTQVTIAGNKVGFDWTVKFSDVMRIVIVVATVGAFYERISMRLDNVEAENRNTAAALSKHIEQQNELTEKATQALDHLIIILKDFPPHRHTKNGEIIYPLRDSDDKTITPPN